MHAHKLTTKRTSSQPNTQARHQAHELTAEHTSSTPFARAHSWTHSSPPNARARSQQNPRAHSQPTHELTKRLIRQNLHHSGNTSSRANLRAHHQAHELTPNLTSSNRNNFVLPTTTTIATNSYNRNPNHRQPAPISSTIKTTSNYNQHYDNKRPSKQQSPTHYENHNLEPTAKNWWTTRARRRKSQTVEQELKKLNKSKVKTNE